MNYLGSLIALFALSSSLVMAEPAPDSSERFPLPLFEVAPSVGFVQQSFPVGGVPTSFWSSGNPGLNLRFNPMWRGKFPLSFQLGGTRVTELNSSGLTVVGEHDNVKYLWNFASRFGFFPLESHRLLISSGIEFNHEAFLRDLGSGQVHLNKVWLQSFVVQGSVEWYRDTRYSSLLDAGVKAIFSLPMDAYLIRNGLVTFGRATLRWKGNGYQVMASLLVENRWQDTTIGKTSQFSTLIEFGFGWGGGLFDGL